MSHPFSDTKRFCRMYPVSLSSTLCHKLNTHNQNSPINFRITRYQSFFFKILNRPFKFIIFLVTEYLHRRVIVKRNTLLNRIAADTVCTGIYIGVTVSVKYNTNRKTYIEVPARKDADATCFLFCSCSASCTMGIYFSSSAAKSTSFHSFRI